MTAYEVCGWIGSFLFSICGVPQAVKAINDGHCEGLSWGFLLTWLGGEILTIIYVWPKADLPLLANYLVNLILLAILIRYRALGK